jgi:hypothetical protein
MNKLELHLMEQNNQVSTPTTKPNPFTTVTTLSKLLALIIFIILPFAGFYLGTKYQKSVTVIPNTVPASPSKENTENHQVAVKNRLLLTKKIEGGQIAAYRLTDTYSSDAFAVILEVGQYHPAIFATSSVAYSEDGLFEIINDELWVVNGQTNKIDVYNYLLEKNGDSGLQLSSLIYKDSISLPKYRVGVIYSLKCDTKSCTVLTAFHQESGCNMVLNPATKEYSNIKCGGYGGEFTPEKL